MFLKRTIVLFLACVGICFGQSVWTPQNSGTTQNLYSVAYDSQFVASGDFVVKGDSGILLTSADAITWTKSSAYSYTFNSTKVYGNGVFVRVFVGAGSPLNFQVSLPYDDSLFISIEYPEAKTNPLSFPNSVTYGGNRQFVAVGYFTTCNYLYNPQGQCGNSGLILVSPPGWNGTYGSANWEEVNDPRPLDSLCSVIYGNGIFVAVGQHGTILTSGADNLSANNTGSTKSYTNEFIINAVKNNIIVSIGRSRLEGLVTVGLYNITGQRVCSTTQQIHDGILNIPIPGLSRGTYLMSIRISNITLSSSFVMMK